MRKIVILLLLLSGTVIFGQKNGDIDYYTDSEVTRSRFSLALILNPNYTDRRLINDEVPSGGGFDLPNENADGSIRLNYNLDLFYAIGSAFDIGIGFGYATASYSIDNVTFYQDRPDTLQTDLKVGVSMFTVPIKFNFNTTMTDVFDLEVVPVVELVFVNDYEERFSPLNNGSDITLNFGSSARSINYMVGLGLGGTFRIADKWGLIVRGNAKYMLNSIIELDNFPRETLYSFGMDLGLKYSF